MSKNSFPKNSEVSDGSDLAGPSRCNVRGGRLLSDSPMFHVERDPGASSLELIVLLVLLVAIALVIGITP